MDDIYNRMNKGIDDNLYKRLNDYHPNIKLTMEINPNKFPDTGIIETKELLKRKCTVRQQSYQFLGLRIFLKGIRGIL